MPKQIDGGITRERLAELAAEIRRRGGSLDLMDTRELPDDLLEEVEAAREHLRRECPKEVLETEAYDTEWGDGHRHRRLRYADAESGLSMTLGREHRDAAGTRQQGAVREHRGRMEAD